VGPALAEIERANEEARDREGPLEGPLRITVPPDFGYGQLGVLIAEFTLAHPKVRLDVDVSTRVVDLVGEGFDLAFRASRVDGSSSLVAKKLTPIELWLVASAPWAHAHKKRLGHPRDLESVPCVLFRPSGEVQRFPVSRGSESIELLLRGPIAGSDFWLTRTCILQSVGAGVMPSVVARSDVAEGRLVRLFPEWTTPTSHAYVVHAQGRYLTARARAFRDFVLGRLKG
jgi:DNA-binding transcriptional LysR family regulator